MTCSYHVVVSPGSPITVETQDASPSPLLSSPEPEGGAVVVSKEALGQEFCAPPPINDYLIHKTVFLTCKYDAGVFSTLISTVATPNPTNPPL